MIGAQSVFSTYIKTFISETDATSAGKQSSVLATFWGCIMTVRLIAIYLQFEITTRRLFISVIFLSALAILATIPLYLAIYLVSPLTAQQHIIDRSSAASQGGIT